MTVTTIPYHPQAAGEAARAAAELRLDRVQEHLDEEYGLALQLAAEYADHLDTGGDPTDYPKPDDRDRQQHGLVRVAREAVFDSWNASRERRSVSYPWGQGMPFRWIVQEYLLDRLGEPVPMAQLARMRPSFKASPGDVADAAWSVQVATQGLVRVRKTKVDGKVAWLAREPQPGDDLVDIGCRASVYRSRLDTMTDEERAEALEQPFRQQVYEYPTEVLS